MSYVSVVRSFCLAVPCVHFVCILFGAPFFYDFVVTLIFSAWLSFLVILPLSWTVDGSITQLLTMFFEQKCSTRTQEGLLWAAYGSLLGAWLGAFVIPLDWDRWWQRYPLPCAFGSTFGFLVGLLGYGLTTKFNRIERRRDVRNSRKQV